MAIPFPVNAVPADTTIPPGTEFKPDFKRKPNFEVADILHAHLPDYFADHKHPLHVHKVLGAIQNSRTSALGGHVDCCTECGTPNISYNSCRDRHCPKCQGLEKERWVEARKEELLPVP